MAARDTGPRWLKFDAAYFANRKVLRAGRNGRDVFLAVLCMNATRGALGFIPIADWEPEYLARYVGISVAEAADGMSSAVTAALVTVESEHVVIVGWDEHWSSKAKTRAEIQRDYRERNRDSNDALPSSNALPIEREIERKKERETTLSQVSKPEKPRKTRTTSGAAQPLPSAWEPSDSAAACAQSLRLDLAEEAHRFKLNAAQRGHTFADPDAAFELWLRRSRDKGKHKSPKPGAYTTKARPDTPFVEPSEQRDNSALQQGSEPRKRDP